MNRDTSQLTSGDLLEYETSNYLGREMRPDTRWRPRISAVTRITEAAPLAVQIGHIARDLAKKSTPI